MRNYILDGIIGLSVGDALGVPVEFSSREELKEKPVTDMMGYGTYNQPPGTWSDDTSMTLCTLDSLSKGLDYNDIMDKFVLWINEGEYTPYNEVFDIGITSQQAILKYIKGENPLDCGGKSEMDNGNGSLMRILPLGFYLYPDYVKNSSGDKDWYNKSLDKIMEIIHNISRLTHGHLRSQIACGIYTLVALKLMDATSLKDGVYQGISEAFNYYRSSDYMIKENHVEELKHFSRLESTDFHKTLEENIKSSGYVVDTLEAALWCLLTTNSYRDCVLKAVNLGEDTDTVAAVAGGLAGIYYGYDQIPKEWLDKLARRGWIEDLCKIKYKNGYDNGEYFSN